MEVLKHTVCYMKRAEKKKEMKSIVVLLRTQ